MPPGAEHRRRNGVAVLKRGLPEIQQGLAIEPAHGEQAFCGQVSHHVRHSDGLIITEHVLVQRDVPGFHLVIELFAQARADLLGHLPRVNHAIDAALNGKHHLKLCEICFHGRLHVGILKFAGNLLAFQCRCPVHLPQRCRSGCITLKGSKLLLPVAAEFRGHAPLHKGPPHGRGIRLKLSQLKRIFFGYGFGNGGQHLRHLHDGAFHAAQRVTQFRRHSRIIDVATKQTRTCYLGGNATNPATDFCIALGAPNNAVVFICRGVIHD